MYSLICNVNEEYSNIVVFNPNYDVNLVRLTFGCYGIDEAECVDMSTPYGGEVCDIKTMSFDKARQVYQDYLDKGFVPVDGNAQFSRFTLGFFAKKYDLAEAQMMADDNSDSMFSCECCQCCGCTCYDSIEEEEQLTTEEDLALCELGF